jgi:hypothetical protein
MSKKSIIILIYHRYNLLELINEFGLSRGSGVLVAGVPSLCAELESKGTTFWLSQYSGYEYRLLKARHSSVTAIRRINVVISRRQ